MSNYLRETVTHGDEVVEILIEVDEPSTAPWTPYEYDTMRGDQPEAQSGAFKKGMRLIRACAEQVADTVRKVRTAARPDEVEVKFGVKLTGETGALIAKTGTEAQMEVTLKWTEKKAEKAEEPEKAGEPEKAEKS